MNKEELLQIHDVYTLRNLKETLKSQVIENITWQERMSLYKQIQLLNDRIRLCLMEI